HSGCMFSRGRGERPYRNLIKTRREARALSRYENPITSVLASSRFLMRTSPRFAGGHDSRPSRGQRQCRLGLTEVRQQLRSLLVVTFSLSSLARIAPAIGSCAKRTASAAASSYRAAPRSPTLNSKPTIGRVLFGSPRSHWNSPPRNFREGL